MLTDTDDYVLTNQSHHQSAETRLQEWAAQIRKCQNRLPGISVKEWCGRHDVTVVDYSGALGSSASLYHSNFVYISLAAKSGACEVVSIFVIHSQDVIQESPLLSMASNQRVCAR